MFLPPFKMAALADSVLDALVYEHLSKKDKTFAAVFQKKFQSVSKCCYSKCSLVLSEVSDGVFFLNNVFGCHHPARGSHVFVASM